MELEKRRDSNDEPIQMGSDQPGQPRSGIIPAPDDALAEPIGRALARGGVVLIPAFAVDRTPVLLMALRELMTSGALPVVPVYVDSPMALAALEVYREAVREGSLEIRAEVRRAATEPRAVPSTSGWVNVRQRLLASRAAVDRVPHW